MEGKRYRYRFRESGRVQGNNGHANSEMSTVADKDFFFFIFIFAHVPVKSQTLVFEPILSPSLPMKAPPTKLRREHNACWSAVRNVVSPGVSHNRASARASYTNRYGREKKKTRWCELVRT